MERNDKIILIASSAIVAGSSAVFAVASYRKNKGTAALMKKVEELKSILTDPAN